MFVSILPAYHGFYHSKARYALLYGGAGSGKSVAAAQKMLLRALTEPGARLLCVRKFRSTLRRSVWALLCQLVAEAGLDGVVEAYVSTLTLRFPNGAEILCTGVDDPEKLKSIQGISSVWVEEATELKEADFRQLELRVRGETPGYKQFVLTFNPVDMGSWVYGRFFSCEMRVGSCEMRDASCEKGEVGEEESSRISQLASGISSDIFKLHTTQADNPELDAAYRDYLEEQLRVDENLFRIYSLGLWGHLRRGGAFYKQFSMGRHVAAAGYRKELALHLAFDFNLHPYMTCTVWQVEGREFRQIDEVCLESPRNSTEDMAAELLARYGTHRAGAYLYGDPGGHQIGLHTGGGYTWRYSHYQMLERALRALNVEVRVPRSVRPVAERGIFLNAVLRGGVDAARLTLDPGCRRTIEDYQHLLEGPDGTKQKSLYTHPETGVRCQQYGHCSDANDYFLCEVLKDAYRTFFRADTDSDATLRLENHRSILAAMRGGRGRVWG